MARKALIKAALVVAGIDAFFFALICFTYTRLLGIHPETTSAALLVTFGVAYVLKSGVWWSAWFTLLAPVNRWAASPNGTSDQALGRAASDALLFPIRFSAVWAVGWSATFVIMPFVLRVQDQSVIIGPEIPVAAMPFAFAVGAGAVVMMFPLTRLVLVPVLDSLAEKMTARGLDPPPRSGSLRRQLTAMGFGYGLGATIFVGSMTFANVVRSTADEAEQLTQGAAQHLRAALEVVNEPSQIEGIVEGFDNAHITVFVADASGGLRHGNAARTVLAANPQLRSSLRASQGDSHRSFDRVTRRAVATTSLNRETVVGAISAPIDLVPSSFVFDITWFFAVIAVWAPLTSWFMGESISDPIRKVSASVQQFERGQVDQVLSVNTDGEMGALADSLRAALAIQRERAAVANELAAGALEHHVEILSEHDVVGQSLQVMRDGVRRLVSDVERLVNAAEAGQLDVRADPQQHRGDYRRLIEGMNATLDAIVAPIRETADALDSLATYDLRKRLNGNHRGEYEKMKGALNTTSEVLHSAMSQVAGAAQEVRSGTTEIASSSEALATGVNQQAGWLQETSSSLEQIAATTKRNADSTQQARQLSTQAKASADAGDMAMAKMVEAMVKIRASAEDMAEIISDVGEIAFQTNLLALNAAVEAARAGDAGRGFAVVAEEVRALALRSKEASKRTDELIKRSIVIAEEGSDASTRAKADLTEIVTSVGQVTSIVEDIATASTEQAQDLDRIHNSVAKIDRVIQQAAATAEQTSSAARAISGQATGLANLVERFEL